MRGRSAVRPPHRLWCAGWATAVTDAGSSTLDLLIDVGNTNLKWATRESGRLGEMRSIRHHGALPLDLHAAWEMLPPPARVGIASVAGSSLDEVLVKVCRSAWDLAPEFAHTLPAWGGVTVAYAEPERLGVDRWAAMIAARRLSTGPALIVDAGTALTCDLLRADGRHLGGVILPGIEMMREAILNRTGIPPTIPRDADGPWAADTAGAIAAGSLQAPAALIGRLRDRLADAAAAEPAVLITGGDAHRLLPALARRARHEPDLVLQGLALWLR